MSCQIKYNNRLYSIEEFSQLEIKDFVTRQDLSLEEIIAEDFVAYYELASVDEQLLKKTPFYKQLSAATKRLFRKMYLAMKAAVGLNLSQEEIFFRIQNKSYKNFKPKRNVDKFAPSTKAYVNNVKQQDRVSLVNREFIELYNEFKEEQKKANPKLKDKDIVTKAVKFTQEENLYKKLAETFRQQDVALKPLLEEGEIDSATYDYLVQEYNEMADKLYKDGVYGPLYYNALSDLKKYAIRVNVLKGDLERDENQDTKETWMEANESPFESFTALLKQGLATLQQGRFSGKMEEGGSYKEVIYDEDYDDMGQPRYVDANEAYAALLENGHSSLNEEDMMSKIKDMADNYPWAVQLHKVLSESVPSSIITNPQLFKTQLYNIGLQSQMPTFKYLLELFDEGKRKWVFANSSSKGLVDKLKKLWTSNLTKQGVNKLLKDGVINTTNLEAVKTRLKNKKDDVNLLYNVLNYVGITIPLEAVNNIVAGKEDLQKWVEQIFNNLVSDKTSDEGLVTKAIVKVAELAKKYYKEYNQASHTSVENEMVNNYIRNSFMGRTIEKFKRGDTSLYRKDVFYSKNKAVDKFGIADDTKDLWLDRFDKSFRNKLDFALVDGIKGVSGQSTLFPDMSRLEFEAFSINAFYNNGNGLPKNKGVGKAYYSAQLMADSASHALIGFESYTNEDVLTKLVEVVTREYDAILEHRRNPMAIKLNEPKFMFVPNITEADFDEKNPNYLINLRDKIKTGLDKVVKSQLHKLTESGVIEKTDKIRSDLQQAYKSDYISEGVDIPNLVESFVYNDYFAQTQIISLFHGKLFMYKSMEDFYKRAKEIWSPGNFINTEAKDVNGVKINDEFFTLFVESEGLNYQNNKEAIDAIMDSYRKIGLNEILVLENGAKYGYTDGTIITKGNKEVWGVTLPDGRVIESSTVDSTDAQGIIDIHRWKEISLGKGIDPVEVERVYDAVVNDTYKVTDLTMVLNPFKQFFYQLTEVANDKGVVVVPTQIKNSEYVLIPQVAKGNPELENILAKLEATRKETKLNGSINFNSAVKVGERNLNKDINSIEPNKAIRLKNEEYRIQGEVPEHQVDTENLLGTQFRKLMVGDISLEEFYEVAGEAMTGSELRDEWNQLLIAHVEDAFQQLEETFNDDVEFYKELQKEAESKDMPEQYIQALTLVDGKPRMNLSSPMLIKKSVSLISSIYRNRITKIKFPGASMPNVTAYGFEREPQVVYKKDGSVDHFEAYMPLTHSWLADYMDEGGFVNAKKLKQLGLDMGIAYRIPTENKYSMIPIKIIGFTNAGIALPKNITAVAGLDFDIDKMYVMLYSFKVIKDKDGKSHPVKVEYDKTKPIMENSRDARNNRMMDIALGVLRDVKTTQALMIPGGFVELKEEANRIAKIKGKDKENINPMTLEGRATIFERMMAGKKLIGIPANYNSTHALMQDTGLELVKPVLFNGLEGKNLGLKYVMNKAITVTSEIAQFLASVVDNGKDPLANLYNLNTYTADVVMLITKFFGKETAMKFSAQPSVVKFYEVYTNLGGNSKAELEAALQVLKIGKKDYYDMLKEDDVDITEAMLESGLRDSPDSGSQKEMLKQFLRYKKNQAKDLGKLVAAIKVPDNGMRSTLEKTIGGIDRVKEAKELTTITGIVDFFENEKYANNTTYAKGIVEAMNRLIKLKFPDFQSEDSAWNSIREQINEENDALIGEKDLTLLHDSAMTYLSAGFEPLSSIDRLNVIKETPELLRQLLAKDTSQYSKLLNSLEINTSKTSGYDVITLTSGLGKDAENDIINLWENMKNSADPLEHKFGNMLIHYAFVTNGFRFSPGSLAHIQPISFYENMRDSSGKNYNEFMEQQIRSANTDKKFLDNYLQQFIRHYYPRLSWVKEFDNKTASIRYDDKSKEPYSVELDTFADSLRNGEMPNYVKVKSKELKKTFLFKHDFEGKYYRIESLGIYREFEEFVYNNPQQTSIFAQNNIKEKVRNMYDKVIDAVESDSNNEIVTPFTNSKMQQVFYHADKRTTLNNKTLVDDYSMLVPNGVFFTDNLNYAQNIAKEIGGVVYSVYLDIQKPFNTNKQDIQAYGRLPKESISELDTHDSIIHISNDEKADKYGIVGTEVVIHDENQIRLISNNVAKPTANIKIGSSFEKNNMTIDFQEEPTTGYRNRTIKNASADATIALAVDFNSAGEKLTKSSVLGQNKKYISVNANILDVTPERVDGIVNELNKVSAKTLNIAGNGIYTMKGKYTQKQVDDFTYDLLNQVINSPNLKTKIVSIRSGGQTGFDEAGAKAGIKLGLPTIVLAPKRWTFRNISGQDISNEQQFKARFGEVKTTSKPQQLNLFEDFKNNFNTTDC